MNHARCLLECEVVSEITGTMATCNAERRGQSQYEINYQPTIKGRYQLHIKVEGEHVEGSPFWTAVKAPIEKLGVSISNIYCMNMPWGVAVNSLRREVVVTESRAHCVSVFGPRGEKLRSFGRFGFCNGQLDDPCGVTVDGVGSILVADCGNHRIQNEGEFIKAVGIEPLHFSYPTDIALNTFNDKFYVVENGNRVQILNSDFSFAGTFGKEGSGKGHFKCPSLVACDSTGKVHVADVRNHRIQVFTAEGKFLWMFGRRGRGRGELDMPIGIAIPNGVSVNWATIVSPYSPLMVSSYHHSEVVERKQESLKGPED